MPKSHFQVFFTLFLYVLLPVRHKRAQHLSEETEWEVGHLCPDKGQIPTKPSFEWGLPFLVVFITLSLPLVGAVLAALNQ